MPNAAVPFTVQPTVSDVVGGVLRAAGRVRYAEGRLVLELRTTNHAMQASPVRAHAVDLADLRAVDYRRGTLAGRIVLRANRVGALDGLPGVEGDVLPLTVPRSERDAADALVARLRLDLSERRRHALDAGGV